MRILLVYLYAKNMSTFVFFERNCFFAFFCGTNAGAVYPADLGRRVKKKTQKRLVKALGSDFTWLQ